MEDSEIEIKRVIPFKTIAFLTVFLFGAGGYCTITGYNYLNDKFQKYKKEFIETEVVEYLKSNPIVINETQKVREGTTQLEKVDRKDLLKMVYVTKSKLDQCQTAFQSVRDVVAMSE